MPRVLANVDNAMAAAPVCKGPVLRYGENILCFAMALVPGAYCFPLLPLLLSCQQFFTGWFGELVSACILLRAAKMRFL